MPNAIDDRSKGIVDREMLMHLKTCAACGRKFNLGEPVVLACGQWDGPPRWIHAEEAVWNPQTGIYVDRQLSETDR
jgi:hypothetical protein